MKPYAANGGKPVFEEGMSPVGLVVHLYHDKPQLKTTDQYGKVPDIDPETGIQRAEYKVTLAWDKRRAPELQDMVNMALKVQETAWPGSTAPGAFFALEPFFRDGDNPAHNTEGRDYLKGKYYLNFKKKAKHSKDPNTGQVKYEGAPGLLGPYGPDDKIMMGDLWPGCTARVSFIMFGTEYMGKHFISTRMQNLQKYDEGDGVRIGGGGTPDAAKQFGALMQGAPPAGAAMFGTAPQTQQGGQQNPFGLGGASQQQANPFAPAPAQNGAFGQSPSNPFGQPVHRML